MMQDEGPVFEVFLGGPLRMAFGQLEVLSTLGVLSLEHQKVVLGLLNKYTLVLVEFLNQKESALFQQAYKTRGSILKLVQKAFDAMDGTVLKPLTEQTFPNEYMPFFADARARAAKVKMEALATLKDASFSSFFQSLGMSGVHDCANCPSTVRDTCNLPEKAAWENRGKA